MNRIEDYIKANIDAFDTYTVPKGSKDIFLGKVKEERHRRVMRTIVVAISSMAAAAAIVLFIAPSSMAKDIEYHHRRLAFKETEILTLISERSPEELEEVMNTIRSVTSDAVTLEEQLPDEMEEKRRKEILKEYYESKYKALEHILDQYKSIKTD